MKWQGKDKLIVTVKLETGEFTQFLIDFSGSIPEMKELSNTFDINSIPEDEIKFKFFEAMSRYSWLTMNDYETFRNIYANLKHEEAVKLAASKMSYDPKSEEWLKPYYKTDYKKKVDKIKNVDWTSEDEEVSTDERNSNEE
jgi:hypothetical protein